MVATNEQALNPPYAITFRGDQQDLNHEYLGSFINYARSGKPFFL